MPSLKLYTHLDGNGRVGRLLIPLFMVHKGIINKPNFYISQFFEENRDDYYDRLRRISSHDQWTEWCEYFLQALTIQANENRIRVLKIMLLHKQQRKWARETLKSRYGETAIDWFFGTPIFNTSNFTKNCGIPEPTARRILKISREQGLLKYLREPAGSRPGVLMFTELLSTAEGK